MSNFIYAFVRFFKTEAHRDTFMRGDLYMNRLSYFKGYEEASTSNIGDEHEGLHGWLQPDEVTMKIHNPETGEEHAITGFIKPVTVGFAQHDDYHVYCMSALYCDMERKFSSFAELESEVMLDLRLGDLGEYCSVIESKKFIERLEKTLHEQARAGNRVGAGLVDYFDPETFSGFFEGDQGIMNKKNCFRHQREYRVFVYNGTSGDDYRILNIGDLSDIVFNCHRDELSKFIVLNDNSQSND